jgi:predicted nuclease with TOPRIM domain
MAKARKEPPQVKRLKTRVRNLKDKLAESVPRTEMESLKANLEAKTGNLETRLARSVPKEELDALRARLKEMESKLAESIKEPETPTRRICEHLLEFVASVSLSSLNCCGHDLSARHSVQSLDQSLSLVFQTRGQ